MERTIGNSMELVGSTILSGYETRGLGLIDLCPKNYQIVAIEDLRLLADLRELAILFNPIQDEDLAYVIPIDSREDFFSAVTEHGDILNYICYSLNNIPADFQLVESEAHRQRNIVAILDQIVSRTRTGLICICENYLVSRIGLSHLLDAIIVEQL